MRWMFCDSGGIYVDLDFDSYKSLEPIFAQRLKDKTHGILLGRMADPFPHNDFCQQNSIPNAFLASTPGHPFWLTVLDHVSSAWELNEPTSDGKPARGRVEYITGPIVLQKAYNRWIDHNNEPSTTPEEHRIMILEPELLYPLAWYATREAGEEEKHETLDHAGEDFDLEEARRSFNNGIAYACTYCGSSWKAKGWKPGRERRA